MWEPRLLTTLWASTACYRDSFTFTFIGFTDYLDTQFVSTRIYNGLTELHTPAIIVPTAHIKSCLHSLTFNCPFNCDWLFSSDSRTELTWLPQFSSLYSSARPAQRAPFILVCVSVAAGTCLPSCSLAAAVCSCLLRICCLATSVVPLSFSRPLPRNECCFRTVR
jgi:hypothetical protein